MSIRLGEKLKPRYLTPILEVVEPAAKKQFNRDIWSSIFLFQQNIALLFQIASSYL